MKIIAWFQGFQDLKMVAVSLEELITDRHLSGVTIAPVVVTTQDTPQLERFEGKGTVLYCITC